METSLRSRNWLITSSPDPETAAHYLDLLEQRHETIAARLKSSPLGLQILVAIFSNSRFLSEEVLQHPEWVEDLVSAPDLYRVSSTEDIASRLHDLRIADDPASALALFRRRELLRVLVRDALGFATLSEVTEEISNLADAILHYACQFIRTDLATRYGTPVYENGPCGFSILALGKLGGRELNYSSDVDLMFLYEGNGETNGQTPVSNSEFFRKLANSLTEMLSTYTSDGLCYRVDLRLRPEGRFGEVCISLDGARNYYATRARDWELQMMIKARVAAGDAEPGKHLLDFIESRIYSSTLDFSSVEQVSLTRERIHEKVASRRPDAGLDVKLTRGGIRDIEFLVQCLQRLHGGREPWVRHAGTLLALQRLNDKKLISETEYSRLATAYQFLRYLEHRLQLIDDRQTHTLPTGHDDLEVLARRMPASELGRQPSPTKLLNRLQLHLEEVQMTYDRVIHSQQPLYYGALPPGSHQQALAEPVESPSGNLVRFLDQRAPSLAIVLKRTSLPRSARSFEAFLEKAADSGDTIDVMNADPRLTADILELFENSPWFAEELIRRPYLTTSLAQPPSLHTESYQILPFRLQNATELRRFFRLEMLRIQAESICRSVPIFETLARTSDLADAVVCTAYVLAREEVKQSHPPENPHYEPEDQMIVIALGRLGMREFDLGSDADLNFVLPDEDSEQMQFWTRVAERMVDLISAYTGEGVMFTVDTRLRPNGREGTLVQTSSAYKDYIATRAEAWEGISYMKSRALAGDSRKSTVFLHELQEVDWRRYGQSGRSRTDLREMRARLERELGESNPLKAGPGGYYDIDFALMYLRLKSAGIFFKVLNTPERIDIIEKMGHLEPKDASFLSDAATLYRAIDHGLRIYSGHAEGRLPQSPVQLEAVTNLVRRWTPAHLHDQPLRDELDQIQESTREYFRRLFG